jgi:hypothetical protein
VAEELLVGQDLLCVEELAEKGRVGLGGWMLHFAAEACLAVLLRVRQSSHQVGSVVYQLRDSMEMWNKAHPVRSSTRAVFLWVWHPGYFAKAMHWIQQGRVAAFSWPKALSQIEAHQ